jgi:D-serine deaminase-like pyridoxal phosphate-dependent protein
MAADAQLREARDAFQAAGIACDRISGGSTPTRSMTHETCVTELRSGTYALGDRNDPPAEGVEQGALWIEVTVISDAVPDQVVVDAGSKTLTSDSHDDGGHGAIVGYPDARLRDINEEHGYVDVSAAADRPRVGQHLQIIPNHACGCVNLQDAMLGVRDGVVEQVLSVGARGLIR